MRSAERRRCLITWFDDGALLRCHKLVVRSGGATEVVTCMKQEMNARERRIVDTHGWKEKVIVQQEN